MKVKAGTINPTSQKPLSSREPVVLITISGKDNPGITSAITEVLAKSEATVLDIGQSVIRGLLSLSILFQSGPGDGSEAPTIKNLLLKATQMGLKLEFQVLEASNPKEAKAEHLVSNTNRYALTILGRQISARAVYEVTQILANDSLNIDQIQRLSEGEFSCVEFLLSTNQNVNLPQLKEKLLKTAKTLSVDISFQAEGLFRRTKRLIVLDMDSTLIQNEVINEFARQKGVFNEVARITEKAMLGEIDFNESLEQRCNLIKGINDRDIDQAYNKLELTPGAEELCYVLKKLGYKIAIISGGFLKIAEKLKSRLGLDFAYANRMEFKDGEFTGKIIAPYLDAQRKADLLDVISQQENIELDQVIAIGDGANDLLMLEKAGLGIAFNAKPIVQAQADFSLSQKNLRNIFYLLGLSGRDIKELLKQQA